MFRSNDCDSPKHANWDHSAVSRGICLAAAKGPAADGAQRNAAIKGVTCRRRRNRIVLRTWATCVLAAALVVPIRVSATLGGDMASIAADQMQMNAVQQNSNLVSYALFELQLPSGTVVREYVSPSGTVFAVVWQGPAQPDLKQILGKYFELYTQAIQAQRDGRGPSVIQQSGLVVETGGHMRAFFGRAYLPQALPNGVSVDKIQ
jgi:hypothetical protein